MNLLAFALVAAWLIQGQAQEQGPAQTQKTEKQPEFFDEPQFVVSGVKDYTYRGGHGSDSVLRSTEGLTKAAASLGVGSRLDALPLPEALARKKTLLEQITREPANAELRRQLADVEEWLGNALDAVHEYQLAAELSPSEPNLFDWGAELLRHRAGEPAVSVFSRGSRAFPDSARMRLGLAVAFQVSGHYEQSAQQFFAAADLHPEDPTPYLFLGRAQAKEITASAGYRERMERFARIQPDNAWANYYYATCLWARRGDSQDRADIIQVKQLAARAIQLDSSLAPAYLLLGAVNAEEKNLPDAVAMFRKAVEISPDLEEAHYRLAQAYELTGEPAKAREERAVYKKLSEQSAEATERERRELRQFVFVLRDGKQPSEK